MAPLGLPVGEHHCPTCGTLLSVRASNPDMVKVDVKGAALPAKCCQEYATQGHQVLGMFATHPSLIAGGAS